jgi:hypothetical protein
MYCLSRVNVLNDFSIEGFVDTRVIIQTSLPITSVTLTMGPTANKSSAQQITQQTNTTTAKLPVQQQFQRKSLADQQIQQLQNESKDNTPLTSPGQQKKPFRFSSLRRKRHSKSTDTTSPSVDTLENNEALIMAFQRELQNLPKHETSPVPSLPTSGSAYYSNSIASYIRDALERSISPAFTRPRSCSVPRVTFDNMASASLQLPNTNKSVSPQTSPLIRSATTEGAYNASSINVPTNTNSGNSLIIKVFNKL